MTFGRYAALSVSLSTALLCGAQAPITLVSPGNVPVNGTSFLVQRGAYAPPASGGADVLFNFSAAAPTSSATYQWQDPALLPNSVQFTGAQYALTNGGPDTIYYKATAAGLERVGDAQTIMVGTQPYPGTTVYSNSMLELQLPYTFSSTPWTDLFTGAYTVDGNTTARNGAINGQADAWGRVIMPGGADTVEVLRVKTRINESIPLTISGFAVTVSHIHNVTAYYPLWGKFPVLRTVTDSLSSMVMNINDAYTEWLDASAVGLQEQAAQQPSMHLFPNPAKESTTVLVHNPAGSPVDLAVYDLRGSLVLHEQFSGMAKALDLKQWDSGLYQVVLSNAKGQRAASRLVVAR